MKIYVRILIFISFMMFSFTGYADSGSVREVDFDLLKPFMNLQKCLKEKPWGINNFEKAVMFNAERKRLGSDFEKELFVFLGTDIDACYWAGIFLTNDYYLNGNEPMYELGLKILEHGIELCRKNPGREIEIISFAMIAAVLYEKTGFHERAAGLKCNFPQ